MAPWSLQRLGLPGDATERDVRRAYARELKQIDQDEDPAGFQQLRETYDAALAFVRHAAPPAAAPAPATTAGQQPRAAEAQPEPTRPACDTTHEAKPAAREEPLRQAAPEPAVAADQQPLVTEAAEPAPASFGTVDDAEAAAREEPFRPAPDPLEHGPGLDHEVLARAVFAEFLVASQALASLPAARDLLVRFGADERLAAIDTSHHFERLLVEHLASGWRPGNEHLLAAALDHFAWRHHLHGLKRFGSVSARLEAAIVEIETLNAQPVAIQREHLDLLRSLRYEATPPAQEHLRYLMPALNEVAALYPNLTFLTAQPQNLHNWLAAGAAFRHLQRPSAEELAGMAKRRVNRLSNRAGFTIMGVFIILIGKFIFSDDPAHRYAAEQKELAFIESALNPDEPSRCTSHAVRLTDHVDSPDEIWQTVVGTEGVKRILDCSAKGLWPNHDAARRLRQRAWSFGRAQVLAEMMDKAPTGTNAQANKLAATKDLDDLDRLAYAAPDFYNCGKFEALALRYGLGLPESDKVFNVIHTKFRFEELALRCIKKLNWSLSTQEAPGIAALIKMHQAR